MPGAGPKHEERRRGLRRGRRSLPRAQPCGGASPRTQPPGRHEGAAVVTDQQPERRTSRRQGLLSLLAAFFLTLGAGAVFFAASPASADPVDRCTATTGAVVAVDFGPFGGPVVRGCDTTPTTGYELLHEGGFSTTGTVHDGDGFICRIGNGSFDTGTEYPTPAKEDCVLTPQATAYWSYWIASPGRRTGRTAPSAPCPAPPRTETSTPGCSAARTSAAPPASPPSPPTTYGPRAVPPPRTRPIPRARRRFLRARSTWPPPPAGSPGC